MNSAILTIPRFCPDSKSPWVTPGVFIYYLHGMTKAKKSAVVRKKKPSILIPRRDPRLDIYIKVDHDITIDDRRKPKRGTAYMSEISFYDNNHFLTKVKGEFKIMAVVLKDTQQASGILKFTDSKGYDTDAKSVSVSSSDTSIATVEYDDPTNRVTVKAVKPGVAALTISATDDNDQPLSIPDTAVEVRPGNATGESIVFDAPTEQTS